MTSDENTITFTKEEFKSLIDSLKKASEEAMWDFSAIQFEQFAEIVEKAPIVTGSAAAKSGAETAIQTVAKELRAAATAIKNRKR